MGQSTLLVGYNGSEKIIELDDSELKDIKSFYYAVLSKLQVPRLALFLIGRRSNRPTRFVPVMNKSELSHLKNTASKAGIAEIVVVGHSLKGFVLTPSGVCYKELNIFEWGDKSAVSFASTTGFTGSTSVDSSFACAAADGALKREIEELTAKFNGLESVLRDIQNSAGPVHKGIYCDNCNPESLDTQIKGVRYHCLDCPDFDLCAACFAKGGNSSGSTHKSSHKVEKITEPRTNNRRSNTATVVSQEGDNVVMDMIFESPEARELLMSVVQEFNSFEKLVRLKQTLDDYKIMESLVPSGVTDKSSFIRSAIYQKSREVEGTEDVGEAEDVEVEDEVEKSDVKTLQGEDSDKKFSSTEKWSTPESSLVDLDLEKQDTEIFTDDDSGDNISKTDSILSYENVSSDEFNG